MKRKNSKIEDLDKLSLQYLELASSLKRVKKATVDAKSLLKEVDEVKTELVDKVKIGLNDEEWFLLISDAFESHYGRFGDIDIYNMYLKLIQKDIKNKYKSKLLEKKEEYLKSYQEDSEV